jgi:hypothetical protein
MAFGSPPHHVSLVPDPAYADARVLAVRGRELLAEKAPLR